MTYRTLPCSLRREPCLKGKDLAERLGLEEEDDDQSMSTLVGEPSESKTAVLSNQGCNAARGEHTPAVVSTRGKSVEMMDCEITVEDECLVPTVAGLSRFEAVFTNHPPILESLLSQLPTKAVLSLYHTNQYIRSFLSHYPLAWKSLSFRLPQPAPPLGTPGHETPDGTHGRSKQYALDGLLTQVIVPVGTILTNLDLCNTAVAGMTLFGKIVEPRVSTLQHLSVRGCKNVSIKYHIVPFLEQFSIKHNPWAKRGELALKSLYAYRCRHHRRRPYLPQSLARRDSDSEPTHQLIEICHALGIWTDTAWCPTPGARCFRRKDYHNGRAAPNTPEVWVPFDRLWRSGNRLGPPDDTNPRSKSERLWEDAEYGHDGEALGTGDASSKGEGKDTPAHARRSHTTFVDNVKCSQCCEPILERCEQCSVRMHCMGCRKTLCASCAFNRPIVRKRRKTRHFAQIAFGHSSTSTMSSHPPTSPVSASFADPHNDLPNNDRFWWAPGAHRSPNLMREAHSDDDSSDSDDAAPMNMPAQPVQIGVNTLNPLKLNMNWCCLEPIFSGGGGIAFIGPHVSGKGADNIRAAPLPRIEKYQDPAFMSIIRKGDISHLKSNKDMRDIVIPPAEIMSFLTQDSLELQATTCPRSLCGDCYTSFKWRVECSACKKPLCREHDFRALKIRKCGWRDLQTERDFIRNYKKDHRELEIPAFKRIVSASVQPSQAASSSNPSLPSFQLSPASSSTSGLDPSTPQPPPHLTLLSSPPSNDMTSASIPNNVANLDDNENNDDFDIDPFSPTSLFSRPRSSSLSDLSKTNRTLFNAQAITARAASSSSVPKPGDIRHPVQWGEGCGAYFCQAPRSIGDSRPRCSAGIKECPECGVYHCDQCARQYQSCPCTFCAPRYHCPACFTRPSVRKQCRYEEERKERLAKEEAARKKLEEERNSLRSADDTAESVGQFFSLVTGGVVYLASEGESIEDEDPNPAPSSDSLDDFVDAIVEAAGAGGLFQIPPSNTNLNGATSPDGTPTALPSLSEITEAEIHAAGITEEQIDAEAMALLAGINETLQLVENTTLDGHESVSDGTGVNHDEDDDDADGDEEDLQDEVEGFGDDDEVGDGEESLSD